MDSKLKEKFEAMLEEWEFDENYPTSKEYLVSAMQKAYSLGLQDQWVSVDEKPAINTGFLIGNKDDEWTSIGYLHKNGYWYNTFDHSCPCYPTHYMKIAPLK